MTSRLIALATTAVATVAVLASASLAFAGPFAGPFAGHATQAAAPTPVAAASVKLVQLERVVITGKRLPQGQ